MRHFVYVIGLVAALNGCALHYSANTPPSVTRLNETATFVQDGVKWTCVIENEAADSVPWRRTRKALCFAVPPGGTETK